MSCLDENTVVDLLRGRTTGQPLAEAEKHLAICDECAQLLADSAGAISITVSIAPANDVGDWPAITTMRTADLDRLGVDLGSLAPGTALNETYRVIRFIGRGGMGEVYEVAHARLSGRYAAKVLTTQIAATPEIMSRFRREAQITSALSHPNIVRVVDFNWTSDGRPFLAMEYLEGLHLGRIIQAAGPMSLERVLQIVAPVVSALVAVHRNAIIHRDLKPQNIMLVPGPDGTGEVVKLLDFGLSKRTGMNPSESLLVSQQRMLLGTPLYMAPEQARGDSDSVGSAADQFALAAIIYEMLTGRAAFAGDTVETVLYRIAHVEPAPMSGFVADVSAPVETVVRRALSKDPGTRFPSIGAFFDAFREAVAGRAAGGREGDLTGAASSGQRVPPDVARTRRVSRGSLPVRAIAVGAATASALAVGLILFLAPPRSPPAVSPPRATVRAIAAVAPVTKTPGPGAAGPGAGGEESASKNPPIPPVTAPPLHAHAGRAKRSRPSAPVSMPDDRPPVTAQTEPAVSPANPASPPPSTPTSSPPSGSLGASPEQPPAEATPPPAPPLGRTKVRPFDKL